jgi:hypothetical protein
MWFTLSDSNKWENILRAKFFSKPGEHLIEVGNTGSGKTQGFFWACDHIAHDSPGETILINDRAKSSESLVYATLKPVQFIYPAGCEIEIQLAPGVQIVSEDHQHLSMSQLRNMNEYSEARRLMYPITFKPITTFSAVWESLDLDKINIQSFRPFIRYKPQLAKVVSAIFDELIDQADSYKIPKTITLEDGRKVRALALFWDEFHEVVPATGDKYGVSELIISNVEDLRSKKVRLVASSHGWTKMVRGVRISFPWVMARRGTIIEKESLRLRKFNPTFESLDKNEAIIILPNKTFTDKLALPYYGEGEDLGRIYYKNPFLKTGPNRDLTIQAVCS